MFEKLKPEFNYINPKEVLEKTMKMFPEFYRNCKIKGDSIIDELRKIGNINPTTPEEVTNASLKVIYTDFIQNFAGETFAYNAYCPRCSHRLDPKNDRWMEYCPVCGQKLDWRNADGWVD